MSIKIGEYQVIEWLPEQVKEYSELMIKTSAAPNIHRVTREDGKVVYIVPEEFIQAVQRLVKESKIQDGQE